MSPHYAWTLLNVSEIDLPFLLKIENKIETNHSGLMIKIYLDEGLTYEGVQLLKPSTNAVIFFFHSVNR